MALLPEVDFKISNIDPLCTQFQIILTKNGVAILDNEIIGISALNDNYLTFPRQGIDQFTFTNGDVVVLKIQQGVSYGGDIETSFSDIQTSTITIDIDIPTEPDQPTITMSTLLNPHAKGQVAGSPYGKFVLTDLDTANRIIYNWTVQRGTETTENFSSTLMPLAIGTNDTIIINSLGPSFIPSITFPINQLQIGDIIILNVITGIALQPNIATSSSVLLGETKTVTLTLALNTNVVAVSPVQVLQNPSIVTALFGGVDINLNAYFAVNITNVCALKYIATIAGKFTETIILDLSTLGLTSNADQSYSGAIQIEVNDEDFALEDELQLVFYEEDPPKILPITFISRVQLTTALEKPVSLIINSITNDAAFNVKVNYTVDGSQAGLFLEQINWSYTVTRGGIKIDSGNIIGTPVNNKITLPLNPVTYQKDDVINVTLVLQGRVRLFGGNKPIVVAQQQSSYTLINAMPEGGGGGGGG